jgi:hypothetical protein
MAFTLDVLAQELGIDPETLKAKSDVVSKWNGYLTQADSQYREAKDALEQAKRDQTAIDEQIQKFGVSEARIAELQTSNAALAAAMAEVKKQGLNVDMSGIPQPQVPAAADPIKTVDQLMRSNFANMGAAMQVQTRYQAVFGKPFADDPVRLIDEAAAARMPVQQYAEQKYKFQEEQNRQSQAEMQRKIDEGISAGVTKYKEEHPVEKGNPSLAKGLASKHPQVFKPRTGDEARSFRSMSPRDRIASSVARAREAVASTSE